MRTMQMMGTIHVGVISRNPQKSPLEACDYATGRWVWDEGYPLRSYDESCPFLDPGFRCRQNGRSDGSYRNWRWQPDSCDLPRYELLIILRSCKSYVTMQGPFINSCSVHHIQKKKKKKFCRLVRELLGNVHYQTKM